MGFVDGFEHDVFISYSHVDNEPSFGFEWVTTFQKELQTLIRQKVSKTVSVWWDEKLPRNEDFNLKLKSLVERSATIVIILTKNSINSEYCGHERNWFFDANNDKLYAEKRVFTVIPDPITPEEKPGNLRQLLGYPFYTTPQGEKSCIRATLADSAPPDCHYKFSAALAELSDAIVGQLNNLKELIDAGTMPNTRPKVFVADVTDDLEKQRDSVCCYLKQAGYSVLPTIDLFNRNPIEFRKAIISELQGSVAFIQLLSEVSSGMPNGFQRMQFEEAKQRQIPIFQWKREGIDHNSISEIDYVELLNELTVRACGIEEFKQAIVRALQPPATKNLKIKDDDSKLVFIHADMPDRKLAESAAEYLVTEGFDVDLGPTEGNAEQIREELKDALSLCDGLLLVYANGQPGWVRSQLKLSKKELALRESPPAALALLDGPPPEKPNPGLYLSGWDIIQAFDWPNLKPLEPFIKRLREV